MKEKIGNRITKVLIMFITIMMVMLLILQHLFVMPIGAGQILALVRGIAGTKMLCYVIIYAIPIVATMYFLVMLTAATRKFLLQVNDTNLEISVLSLFFSLLFIVMGDNRNMRITYDLLHRLLNLRTLIMIFLVGLCVYGCGWIYQSNKSLVARCILCLLSLCIPFIMALIFYGIKEGVIWTFCAYLYCYGVIFLTDFVLKQSQNRPLLALWGSVIIICIVGQSMLSNPGFHLQMNRNNQLIAVLEMFDEIHKREESEDVPIYANNRGMELIRSYDEKIFLPYLPEDMVRGRKARLFEPEEMVYLYEAGNNGEDGLGLLTTYAQGNGYRYVLLVPKDAEEYGMVVNGGYEIVYKSKDFQLYYK